MEDTLEQIKTLEEELQKLEERIETLKREINAGYLVDDEDSRMSWKHDDELANKEEELKNLKAKRDKIKNILARLKNQD